MAADIECPRCGARALSVATRCPRCGEAFPTELVQHPPLRPLRPWLRPVLALGAIVIVVVAIAALFGEREETGELAAPPPADTTPEIPAPEIPAAPMGAAAAPAAGGAGPAPLPAAEAPVPAGGPERRYATTWVNLRQDRGTRSPVMAVLNPGEPVLVDSLSRGWYRVSAEGRTLGYAHRRYLGVAPP